jgi:glycoside/pentoside/hexuronide:cation symporter, GPH family
MTSHTPVQAQSAPLRFSTKFTYGLGHMGWVMPSTLQAIFQLFFLTSVAGLNPARAGMVLLIAKIWDALNDPLVGWLSDRTDSRWGKRYPWIILGAVPFGICFFLLWHVPQFGNGSHQGLLFWYYVVVAILFDTASTAVALPYLALAPELTQNYTERTSLISFQAAFTSGAVTIALILAQIIFATVADTDNQYQVLGGVCGVLSVLIIYFSVWRLQKLRRQTERSQSNGSFSSPASGVPISSLSQFRSIAQNRPFLYILGIFLSAQVALQLSGSMLPYFIVTWMGEAEQTIAQVAILSSVMTILMFWIWHQLRNQLDKRMIFLLAIPFWVLARIAAVLLQPDQMGWLLGLIIVAAIGVSGCLLVPYAMLPDAIDLDELQNGQRREGVFYGFMTLLQKLSLAIALFCTGQALNWAGFVPTVTGQPIPPQPDAALVMIRWIYGPIPALIGIGCFILAYFYPLTRTAHAEILLRLQARDQVSN